MTVLVQKSVISGQLLSKRLSFIIIFSHKTSLAHSCWKWSMLIYHFSVHLRSSFLHNSLYILRGNFFVQILLIINCILVFLFLSETKCIDCLMICKEDSKYCNRCILRRVLEIDGYICKYSVYLSILNISLVKSLKFVSMRQWFEWFFFLIYFHIKSNRHQDTRVKTFCCQKRWRIYLLWKSA